MGSSVMAALTALHGLEDILLTTAARGWMVQAPGTRCGNAPMLHTPVGSQPLLVSPVDKWSAAVLSCAAEAATGLPTDLCS